MNSVWQMDDCYEHLAAITCSMNHCPKLQLWHLHLSGLGVSCHTGKGCERNTIRENATEFKWLVWCCVISAVWNGHWQIQFFSGQACMLSAGLRSVRPTTRKELILGFGITRDSADSKYPKLWSPIITLWVFLEHWLHGDCLCCNILCRPHLLPLVW